MTLIGNTELVWPAGAVWSYQAVYTQTNAGGGAVILDISPGVGSEFEIMYGTLGADNYGAGRQTISIVNDENNALIHSLRERISIDNVAVPLIWISPTAISATDVEQTNLAFGKYSTMVSGTDYWRVQVSSLAQNETVTIGFRIRLYKGNPVTVDRTNSTGTVGAPTVNLNVVNR